LNPLIETLCIRSDALLIEAVEKIESTRFQIVFVLEDDKRLLGIITNGDLRRFLLNGGSSSSNVSDCMNRSFKSVSVDASREELLKIFDLGFGVIPKLDTLGNLVELVTPEYDLASPEAPVLARSRAPVRVSFSGGGSDLTYYFVDQTGLILSTTVALYCHTTLVPRKDKVINIYSEDLNTHQHYDSLAELLLDEQRNLLAAVVSVIKPSYGFDLYVRSDFPVGSGLGGSSAVATAVVAVFNEMRLDHWSPYEIAELAFLAERLCFGVAGGWQDQYASTFGGFNLIELDDKKNLVHAIRLDQSVVNELEECLFLCDTMIKHDSGDLHKKQKEAFSNEDKARQINTMVKLAREMHHHLIKRELNEFGRCLDTAWKIKRGLSTSISSNHIDNIYERATSFGAVGGKLLGAGAGGHFLFFVTPQKRQRVTTELKKLGCKISTFKFESQGVTSWRTKLI
jgi:D-glycero-alpha-D-manno-heptose-7-phosphate kinase